MLLELYDRNHKKLANLTGIKSPHIQRTLEYGDETLDFSYPTSGPWLAQLLTECYIRTDRQEYVVKAVEKSSASAWRKVSCALNIEELEGTPFEDFETVEQTVQAAAEFALEGTGWTVETDADITKKRTIRKEDDTTAWEVVKQIVTTYRVELEIDAVNKRLKFHTRRGQDRGAYFIERLNLRSLGVKTSSYGFYTRLIPIGKDGLHLWQDGKNYIENHQYSDKVITSIWRDERYTVTAALLEDAQARLDEASAPARAYTAELVDLAAQSDKYNALAYDLGDAVLLVSEKTDEREKQRIVKLDEYPDDPLANKAELSNVKQTFAQLQKTEADGNRRRRGNRHKTHTKNTERRLPHQRGNKGSNQRYGGKHRAGSLQNLHDRCQRPGGNRQGPGGWQTVHRRQADRVQHHRGNKKPYFPIRRTDHPGSVENLRDHRQR